MAEAVDTTPLLGGHRDTRGGSVCEADDEQELQGDHTDELTAHQAAVRSRWLCGVCGVEPVLVLVGLAILGSLTTMVQMAYSLTGHHLNYTGPLPGQTGPSAACTNGTQTNGTQLLIQQTVSTYLIYYTLVTYIPGAISTAFLGGLSDTWGRKPVLLIATAGSFLKVIVHLIVSVFQADIYFLLIGCFLEGVGGTANTLLFAANAYITDCTTPKQRSFRFVAVLVCMLLGNLLASFLTGVLIQYIDFTYTLTVLAGMLFMALLYTWVFLPESLPKDTSGKTELCTSAFQLIKSTLVVVTKNDSRGRRVTLLLLVLISLFPQMVTFGSNDAITLYLLNAPRCFTSVKLGVYVGLLIGWVMLGAPVFVRLGERCLGFTGLVLVACAGCALKFILLAAATTDVGLFIAPVFGAVDVTSAVAKARASKIVNKTEIGSLMAFFGWLETFLLLTNIAFNSIYKATVAWFNGFIFVVMASVYVIPASLTILLYGIQKHRKYPQH